MPEVRHGTYLPGKGCINTAQLCQNSTLDNLRPSVWDTAGKISGEMSLMVGPGPRLEEVNLDGKELTPKHREAMFASLEKSTRIKKTYNWKLNLNLTFVNVSSVDPLVLAKAVAQSKEVDLRHCDLTPLQGKTIFAAVHTASRLRKLSIGYNDLSSVSPEEIGRGVNLLETVDMRFTKLTAAQITSIVEQSMVKTSLKMLNVLGSEEVDKKLVARAQATNPHLEFFGQ